MRIQNGLEIAVGVRLGNGEEPIVEAHLGIDRVRGADPVNRAFHFAIRGGAAGFAVEISRATQFDHVARSILHDFVALDDVGVFEPHFAAGFQPEIFRRRRFHEIVAAR